MPLPIQTTIPLQTATEDVEKQEISVGENFNWGDCFFHNFDHGKTKITRQDVQNMINQMEVDSFEEKQKEIDERGAISQHSSGFVFKDIELPFADSADC